ncbi:hypothetical protein KBB06_00765 [Candidatus Gracilibacteria bacterium]|nr:hypothetical protein [Candidatus Gracilibacteria bacterium]
MLTVNEPADLAVPVDDVLGVEGGTHPEAAAPELSELTEEPPMLSAETGATPATV